MSRAIAKLLLWLFVINLGIAFGAGLYESRIVVPQWLEALPEGEYQWNAAAARQADTGLRFWVYVTYGSFDAAQHNELDRRMARPR
jgi:hypothetical protein